MADLKDELAEAERDMWTYLGPRLIIGAVLTAIAAVYIFWH
jgi:hypothetical protein